MHYNMSDKVYGANKPRYNPNTVREPRRKPKTKMSDYVTSTNDRRLYEPFVYS